MFEIIGIVLSSLIVFPIVLFLIMSILKVGLKSRFYRFVFNVSVAWDQLLNALLLGYPDETISSRAGKGRRAGKWYWKLLADILDFFDKNHAEDAIEDDEGRATPPKLPRTKVSPAKRIARRKQRERKVITK